MVTKTLELPSIRIKLDEASVTPLLARGMNRLVLTVKPFLLKPASFTSQPEGLKPKFVEAQQQAKWFQNLVADPFSPACFCISSEPNDRLAKAAAAYLMQAHWLASGKHSNPIWHDLMGNFQNKLVDPNETKPSFLVLANVLPTSTNVKLEKLRDILEYRADIPRVVVTAGADPFTFFNQHIRYPLNGCLYLKTSLVRGDLEI